MPVWQLVGSGLILGLALFALVTVFVVNQRIEADIDRSYGHLNTWARWLGVLLTPAHTPHERADLMAMAVPDGKTPLRSLTRQFVLKQFSRQQAAEEGFDPRSQWRTLRPILLRQALANRLKRWQQRSRRRLG
jgi:hypothetical protein